MTTISRRHMWGIIILVTVAGMLIVGVVVIRTCNSAEVIDWSLRRSGKPTLAPEFRLVNDLPAPVVVERVSSTPPAPRRVAPGQILIVKGADPFLSGLGERRGSPSPAVSLELRVVGEDGGVRGRIALTRRFLATMIGGEICLSSASEPPYVVDYPPRPEQDRFSRCARGRP